MVTDTLPKIPKPAQISDQAANIAAGIMKSFTWSERQPIEEYGRCLINQVAPTTGQTLRFINVLRRYAPYCRQVARLTTDMAALRQLQDEIARHLAGGV